jgi:predicted GNAT superfamily acetyltransferase
MTTHVEIRSLTAIDELRAVEDLQRSVWGMPEREIVPSHQLLAASRAGGVIIGAFAARALIGFCYGFMGVRDSELIFVSHMAGVTESHRSSGVGFGLKRAQRDAALERGVERMVWTYDPMASLNAHFNLHKLGALATRYYVNYYGEMEDDLNRGLPSDRLEVDWWLRDPHVVALMRDETDDRTWNGTAALAAVASASGPEPRAPDLTLQSPIVRVVIPTGFAEIKRANQSLARKWLLAVRQTLRHYLAQGYVAADFVMNEDTGSYILSTERRHDESRAG